MSGRSVFRGHIAGIGTSSGLRAVIGIWQESPFGPFADVMVERETGFRILLAPRPEVADFIAATYSFDDIQISDVQARIAEGVLTVTAGPLTVTAEVGSRTWVGRLLRLLPTLLAVHPVWLRAINPVAAWLIPGVQTAGVAQAGRREYYGATDVRHLRAASVSWGGKDCGQLRNIEPPVRFGFSSVPSRPGLTAVQTTVEEEDRRR